ncbi:aminotransferase class IV [Brevibacterium album]|uniref:aminotransferase class IV n=1 Tax=Brevibacterium album TaxID=417948 RepID=UPI00055770EF|nr:aminotransferase class IV [Brevibacterium album]
MPYALALIDFETGSVTRGELSGARLPVEDLTVHRGEGIFETALVSVDPATGTAHIHGADLHFARFLRSARALDLPEPSRELFDKAVSSVVEDTLGGLAPASEHAGGDPRTSAPAGTTAPAGAAEPAADPHAAQLEFAVRYAMSRGLDSHADADAHSAAGTPAGAHGWVFSISVTPAQQAQRTEGIRAVTMDRGYPAYVGESAPWLLVGAKTLSYAVNEAAAREARARGAHEALFVSHDGIVLEGPNSNIVIRRGGTLLTPDPRAGLLHGTTQRAVFAGAEAEGFETAYADLRVEDVLGADGAWMVSSVRTAVPIHELDGTALADPGDLTARMHSWIRAR